MTNDELNALNEWLRSEEGRRTFENEVQDRLNLHSGESIPEPDHTLDRTLAKIYARSIKGPKRNNTLRRYVRWSAAAAAVVIGIVTTLFTLSDKDIGTLAVHGQSGSPNKTVLTLSDGRRIVVDEYEDDLLSENGSVIRLGKGELEYDRSGQLYADAFHEIHIPAGGEYKLKLHDGTTIWLNSQTHVRYPMYFGQDERRLYLEGEAYFEVAHDSDRPFIVETGGQSITVLGTEFNVSAYPDESNVITTLASGSVSVSSGSDHALLVPGQQALLDKASGNFSVYKVDISNIVAWKDGYIVIEELTLEQIMNKLSRWYGVEYTIDEGVARERKFRGVIPKNEIEDTLEKLEMISNLKLQLHQDVIRVMK